jgi:hypothetical protein
MVDEKLMEIEFCWLKVLDEIIDELVIQHHLTI